jgi:hypothetical protein
MLLKCWMVQDVSSDVIPVLFVFNIYCVRMHCQAEGSHLTIDNLFGLHIIT